jgi:Mg/Co/Ni transporter MgtE
VDRYSFIFCYEGGRWREFIVAAGSGCIWNVTAFRILWMFYEKYKRLEIMHHFISLLIAVFLSADT